MGNFHREPRPHASTSFPFHSVGAILVASITLAACGSSSAGSSNTTTKHASNTTSTKSTSPPSRTPLQEVQLAGSTSAKVKSMHLTFNTVGTSKLGTGQSITTTISGSGDVDVVNSQASFTMTETMSLPGSKPMTMQVILANGMDYISSNSLSGLPGVNKPWISSNLSGESGSTAITGVLTSPSQMLSILSQVGQVTNLGNVNINGVPTTEYSVNVNVKALASHNIDTPMVGTMRCFGTTNLPIKLWIDSQGRVIRYNMIWQFTMPGGTGGMSEVINATYNFSNFGGAVNVSPPSASQTQPLSSIMPATPSSSHATACVTAG